MTECRDCGKEGLVWGKTKAGEPTLMELRPHFIGCKKRRKKPSGRPQDEAVGFLMGLGYKKREGERMVYEVPKAVIAAGDVAAIVTAALKASPPPPS